MKFESLNKAGEGFALAAGMAALMGLAVADNSYPDYRPEVFGSIHWPQDGAQCRVKRYESTATGDMAEIACGRESYYLDCQVEQDFHGGYSGEHCFVRHDSLVNGSQTLFLYENKRGDWSVRDDIGGITCTVPFYLNLVVADFRIHQGATCIDSDTKKEIDDGSAIVRYAFRTRGRIRGILNDAEEAHKDLSLVNP